MVTLALTIFGWDLTSEPHFADESAYISQSFYADLWFHQKWDDPHWLTYAGYDLPPLPKYAIGLSLWANGYRRPAPSTMVAWYRNTSSQFVSPPALMAARYPSVLFGAIGCLAIYALGAIAVDRRVGLLSAVGLMANPLYAMHARRAMSDVMAESLLLSSLAVGLWAWKRLYSGEGKTWVSVVALGLGSGVLGGLATLSKLNGSLSGMILGAWAVLAILLMARSGRVRVLLLTTIVSGCVSFATFAGLNPFLFAHPGPLLEPKLGPLAQMGFWGRVKVISDHRVDVSTSAKSIFPNDALNSTSDKLKAVCVQGFGRFGPFGPRGRTDSTIRYDWAQDRSAMVWLPWVALGGSLSLIRGYRQFRLAQAPTCWAIFVQAGLALVVVTSFIPLAWDRYFLSIQPGSVLFGAIGVVFLVDWVRSKLARPLLPEPLA